MNGIAQWDEEYVQMLLTPLRECQNYRPAFGKNEEDGFSLDQFRILYKQDPLYHWLGLDDDLMYAAHKAAGGMTSIYRQLGIGCERLLRLIIKNTLSLSQEQVSWSYSYDKGDSMAVHTLDARISIKDLRESDASRFRLWLSDTATALDLGSLPNTLEGAIFEIRQGYKSADSKRQNADLRFGLRSYTDVNHLPVILIVSNQASDTVCRRYRSSKLFVLKGVLSGNESTFQFFNTVIGYDLADFFERNSVTLRTEFNAILKTLLSP